MTPTNVFSTGTSSTAGVKPSAQFSRREDDWSRLEGAYVEMRLYRVPVRAGIVETVAPDAGMLWVAQEGPFPRQLFLRADQYEAWCFNQ